MTKLYCLRNARLVQPFKSIKKIYNTIKAEKKSYDFSQELQNKHMMKSNIHSQ